MSGNKIRYISIKAKDGRESITYQQALYDVGFRWGNGEITTKHINFYARLEDMKLITCYHDSSIDEESIQLSVEDILLKYRLH